MKKTSPLAAVAALAALLALLTLPACGDDADAPADRPDGALGTAFDWVMAQLEGEAEDLTPEEVAAHVSPDLLDQLLPAPAIVELLQRDVDERGPFRFVGLDFPPRRAHLVAIIENDAGERGAVHVRVDDDGRIIDLAVTEAPPARAGEDRDTGWFQVASGRSLYLHCEGSGPSVVLDGGIWSDWALVREQLESDHKVCSFDRPSAEGGASDPAPTPRTGEAHVRDLRTALAQAHVRPPFVVVGHSNSGLFAQVWAVTHPDEIAGLVLVDPATQDYFRRRIAEIGPLLPLEEAAGLEASLRLPPPVLDPEQLDVVATADDLAARWSDRLEIDAVVLTHGRRTPEEEARGAVGDADAELWRTLHEELAERFSPPAEVVVATESGHDIHHEQPDLVADAVRSVG